jgi:hypothetical protein
MSKTARRTSAGMPLTVAGLLASALAGGFAPPTNTAGFARNVPTVSQHGESTGVQSVSVEVRKSTYGRHEPITVVVRNDLARPIHIPADPSACSLLTLQQWQNGSWQTVGSCPPALAPQITVVVPERGRVVGTLISAPRSYVVEARASEPASPAVLEGSLEQLPPVNPWRPGNPITEVPLGVLDPEREALPLSTIEGLLDHGTYRIEVTYSLSMPPREIETRHSRQFIVTES